MSHTFSTFSWKYLPIHSLGVLLLRIWILFSHSKQLTSLGSHWPVPPWSSLGIQCAVRTVNTLFIHCCSSLPTSAAAAASVKPCTGPLCPHCPGEDSGRLWHTGGLSGRSDALAARGLHSNENAVYVEVSALFRYFVYTGQYICMRGNEHTLNWVPFTDITYSYIQGCWIYY